MNKSNTLYLQSVKVVHRTGKTKIYFTNELKNHEFKESKYHTTYMDNNRTQDTIIIKCLKFQDLQIMLHIFNVSSHDLMHLMLLYDKFHKLNRKHVFSYQVHIKVIPKNVICLNCKTFSLNCKN